ncbi:MAG: hypothetical protein V4713_07110 [Pseudomonadota bacterium]
MTSTVLAIKVLVCIFFSMYKRQSPGGEIHPLYPATDLAAYLPKLKLA